MADGMHIIITVKGNKVEDGCWPLLLVCVKFKCHQRFAYISEDDGSFSFVSRLDLITVTTNFQTRARLEEREPKM